MSSNRLHPPELLSSIWIVSIQGHCSCTDEDGLSVGGSDHYRSAIGLAHIAVSLRFSTGVEIAVIDAPRRFPEGLPRQLIECHNELMISTIEVEDKRITMEDWRRAGAPEMIAGKVSTFPDNLTIGSPEARCIGRAESQVYQSVFKRWSR